MLSRGGPDAGVGAGRGAGRADRAAGARLCKGLLVPGLRWAQEGLGLRRTCMYGAKKPFLSLPQAHSLHVLIKIMSVVLTETMLTSPFWTFLSYSEEKANMDGGLLRL